MNHRYLPLTFTPETKPASGPRDCSRAVFRHGPLLAAIFAGAALFPAAGSQAAEPRVITLSAAVPFSDLDLIHETDQQVLNKRTGRAARVLCRRLNPGRNERIWCAQDAVRDAAPQVRQAIAQAAARQMASAAP
jgi:UrcA family protein